MFIYVTSFCCHFLFRLSFCRCEILISPQHRPFFCRPTFFPSPPKPFELPTYAEEIAFCFATEGIRNPTSRSRSLSRRGLSFLDPEAVQCDEEEWTHSYTFSMIACDFRRMLCWINDPKPLVSPHVSWHSSVFSNTSTWVCSTMIWDVHLSYTMVYKLTKVYTNKKCTLNPPSNLLFNKT